MMKLLSVAVVLAALFASICPAQQGHWNIKHRNQYLKNLKRCGKPASYEECNEVTVIDVVILYERGERRALRNLMDAARTGKGVISDTLGWFLSDLLCEQPRTFLNAVLERPKEEHTKLTYLAATGDSRNLGCLAITSLRRTLQTIASGRNASLAGLAAECLDAVNKHSRPNPNTGDCYVKNLRYKPEREIAAMNPRQLVEEEVQNNIHAPDSTSKSGKYWVLTNKYMKKR